MEFTKISGTSLTVSRIGLGTWSIGGLSWGGTDEGQAISAIHTAIAGGVNLIDTAPVYGFGRSEEIIGKALEQGSSRASVVLATKAGLEWDHRGAIHRNSSPARLRAELEQSLRRLRTDVIDLYQVHWPDPSTPMEDTAQALRRFLEEGKIRAIGVSNFTPQQIDDFRTITPVHASQSPYNIFERQIESDVLPYCRAHHITVLAYGAICRGLLSGRMKPDTKFSPDDIRAIDPKFAGPAYHSYLKAVERLDALARERYGKRAIHLALRWLLDQPGVGVALWGARSASQLAPLKDTLGWAVDDETRRAIDRILAEEIGTAVGAEFMAPP
jgi:aryl-alcohol dehydrogenase-like predicted oxidoreductase